MPWSDATRVQTTTTWTHAGHAPELWPRETGGMTPKTHFVFESKKKINVDGLFHLYNMNHE